MKQLPWPSTVLQAARLWQVLLGLLLVLVAWLALTPRPPPELSLGWDKLNHGAAFVALAFCAWLGQGAHPRRRGLALLALLAYGGLIEVAQWFGPGRSGEWADLLADAVGLAIGTSLARLALRLAALAARRWR